MSSASLTRFGTLRRVRGVVLVLHGGQERSEAPVLRRNLAWLRMRLVARAVQRSAAPRGVAVWLLRYQVRGWNAVAGGEPAPVRDARWALDQIRAKYPGVPIVLLGHSMGGRTANMVAEEPDVVGVVALAPWFAPGTPVRTAPLVVLHGTADRMTSAVASRQHVDRVRAAGGTAAWLPLDGAGHAMLDSVGRWNQFARDCALGLLGVTELPADVRSQLEAGVPGRDLPR